MIPLVSRTAELDRLDAVLDRTLDQDGGSTVVDLAGAAGIGKSAAWRSSADGRGPGE